MMLREPKMITRQEEQHAEKRREQRGSPQRDSSTENKATQAMLEVGEGGEIKS